MSYVKPDAVVRRMIQAGETKAKLSIAELLLKGFLGGALLAFATTLAFTATVQTGYSIVGALIFPVGFVMIVLLGLELVTGSFALIPLAWIDQKATVWEMIRNFVVVIIAHILGCFVYALLYYFAISGWGQNDNAVVSMIISVAESKTNSYEAMGAGGLAVVFVKAILCNWMVTLGVVMSMVTDSTGAKIAAMWLPILTFFAQGFEHAVVNMFVIPAGMIMGADVSFSDWWVWNQLPVLLGNFTGGLLFTGLFLYWIYGKKKPSGDLRSKTVENMMVSTSET